MTTNRFITFPSAIIIIGFAASAVCAADTTTTFAQSGPAMFAWQRIDIPESPAEPMVFARENIILSGRLIGPQWRDQSSPNIPWQHTKRDLYNKTLTPYPGTITEDRYSAENIELVRQVWVADSKNCIALRLTVFNHGDAPRQLEAIVPWQCTDDRSFRLANSGDSSDWELVVQAWQKNGDPRAIKPAGNWARDADQFMLARSTAAESLPTLRIGYLDQLNQLAQVHLEFADSAGKSRLKELTARCLFDGCTIPKGGSRTTSWLIMTLHRDPGLSMHEYAQRIADYYELPKPAAPPAVWCSWYYYGGNIREQDVMANLDVLAKNPLPFNVIQIDDGWSKIRGDWFANDKFPSGLKTLANRIKELGYQPGIWTSPYLAPDASDLAKQHPDWLLRHEDNTLHRGNGNACVLDPTYPGVCDFLEDTYRRLTFDYGYTYHKLDFMRFVITTCPICKDKSTRVKLYNTNLTRVEAYRLGLEAIRRGTGPNAHINVCGGNYGASLGLCQSQRSGGDVSPQWQSNGKTVEEANEAIIRSWMNRLWFTDADSMMVRRKKEPNPLFSPKSSIGLFSDDEARTTSFRQYLCGGIAILTENLSEIDPDRLELYKHVIPSLNSPGIVLDPFNTPCASKVLTRITPRCENLLPWVTLTAVNWLDQEQIMQIALTDAVVSTMPKGKYLISEFFSEKVLGLFNAGDAIDLGAVPPHTTKLLRIAPWDGKIPVLAGTDLHYSGGGCEIADWLVAPDEVTGRLDTAWLYPVKITVAFPQSDTFVTQTITVPAGQKKFLITKTIPNDPAPSLSPTP